MYKNEFKTKAWKLPMSDLLYVGRANNNKMQKYGIHTIGDLARTDIDWITDVFGKMGAILWSFANGYDESPVKKENTSAPIKSIGNGTITPRDLETDEDVKIVLYNLAESVAARLRKNGFKCRVVEISIRDNKLISFSRQKKLGNATNITREIAQSAYALFKENYSWNNPTRSLGVRGSNLVNDNYWEQLDIFSNAEYREKLQKADKVVDDIRRRFGNLIIKNSNPVTVVQSNSHWVIYMQNQLIKIRKKHNHYAKYNKDNTSCTVECLRGCHICEYGSYSCPYECKYNA